MSKDVSWYRLWSEAHMHGMHELQFCILMNITLLHHCRRLQMTHINVFKPVEMSFCNDIQWGMQLDIYHKKDKCCWCKCCCSIFQIHISGWIYDLWSFLLLQVWFTFKFCRIINAAINEVPIIIIKCVSETP